MSFTAGFAIVFVLSFDPEIVKVIFSSNYTESPLSMPIHAFMLPIRATVFGAVPRSVNLPRILLIGSVSQIFLNAMLPAILVKMMGAVDAAWGIVLSTFMLALYYVYFVFSKVSRLFHLKTFQ